MSTDDASFSPEDDMSGFVLAVLARSQDDAETYRELFQDHDIPAIVADSDDLPEEQEGKGRPQRTRGFPVLVPEVLLDEASEIVADHDAAAEYYDEDDEDFEEEEEDEFEDFEPDVEGFDGYEDDLEDEDEDDLFESDEYLDEDEEL